MALSDSQVFLALFIALLTGILAVRLGLELYN
jgi:photosystem I reaction center subunit XII|uniref:Photosystem I reaction center subunit XII n=1 Tax=Trebouxiophyceae sp. MX-AZ01 TaxID=1208065 RepID=J7KEL5_9CHLO|nr:photosystem I subunit XII [Trebouxiophyceae sp. MX-AZ01]AFQ93815.1 photosystem I subunit XII [Trebouxiophyceae sp. MX-AZ01]